VSIQCYNFHMRVSFLRLQYRIRTYYGIVYRNRRHAFIKSFRAEQSGVEESILTDPSSLLGVTMFLSNANSQFGCDRALATITQVLFRHLIKTEKYIFFRKRSTRQRIHQLPVPCQNAISP